MKKGKIIATISIVALLGLGVGFGFYAKNSGLKSMVDYLNGGEKHQIEELGGTISLKDLKLKYAEINTDDDAENDYIFKPFYNVEQTTEFTFKFKSNVDPIKAVTVHTDEKCEDNSTVFQFNKGYRTSDGVTVVVKPGNPVLSSDDRKNIANEMWGYAPKYYLSVNYDLDSTTVKKLDNPIIIPFTIKNEVVTPTAYPSISKDGMFNVAWLPVENAVSYKIYQSSSAKGITKPSEVGYIKEYIKNVATVSANETSFIPNMDNDNQFGGNLYKTNKRKDLLDSSKGEDTYILAQNSGAEVDTYKYYVTAVDKNGNESFYSDIVYAYNYLDILPYKALIESTISGELPDTIMVQSVDKKTELKYPINFTIRSSPSEYATSCEYNYEIPGTLLTGVVTYQNENKNFPQSHKSEYVLSSSLTERVEIPEFASSSVPSITDSNYKNTQFDLTTSIQYPKEAEIKLDPGMIAKRREMEVTRIMGNGEYKDSLDSITSYLATDNPKYIYIKTEDGFILKENENVDSSNNKPSTDAEPNIKPSTDEEPNVKPSADVEPNVKPSTDVQTNENVEDKKPAKKVDNDNYIEEQRKSTEKQVEEADKELVKTTSYPVFADTAVQEYLALKFIAQETDISLKGFPKYQYMEELVDDMYYVWYQNPYVLTPLFETATYDFYNQILHIEYALDNATAKRYQQEIYKKSKSIANTINSSATTDEEKLLAIWKYIEENSRYNEVAYEMSKTVDSTVTLYKTYPNTWNTYGILCEGLGVCQSYAYALKLLAYECGIDAVVTTGYLNGGGHAWNAVKISGKWYMFDSTNNNTILGIPYWIYASSSSFINSVGFKLDDLFVDGTNVSEFYNTDNTEDWYYVNGQYAKNMKDVVKIVKDNIDKHGVIMKYDSNVIYPYSFASDFIAEAELQNVDVENLGFVMQSGIIIIGEKEYFE